MRIHIRGCPCFLILVFIMIAGFWMGCGIKGPPIPPKRYIPSAVIDLSYHLDGNTLNLTWTLRLDEQKTKAEPAGCIVYRSRIRLSDPDCPTCPPQFKPIADMTAKTDASGKIIEKTMTYRESLVNNYRYTYKVTVYTQAGVSSKDSNTVVFNYE